LFDRLRVCDILNARLVCQDMMRIMDDYFLHTVLPKTAMSFHVKHIVDRTSPPENEYQHLYPVIRRISIKENRVFPLNRIVFEPSPQEPQSAYTYRHRRFEPLKINFHLHDFQPNHNWPLVAATYYEEGYRQTQKIKFPAQYTRLHRYVRFDTFKNSPIHVFYKDVSESDSNVVRLHAVSIPLDYLRTSLRK
jgi:hypothetical protein